MKANVLAVLLFLTAGCASPPSSPEAPAATESLIRQLEEQERLGVLNGDTQVLQRLWAEQFVVNSPLNTVSPDRATVLNLVRQGRLRYSSFERQIEQVRLNGDVAVVMGAETIRPTAEPPGPSVRRRFTHVWRNEGGGWRLIARHANNVAAP